MSNELLRQYQAALSSRMSSLADDCAAINAAARPLVGELETLALCVLPKVRGLGADLQEVMSTEALFVGSANGVFTTYVGPADQCVYVRPVHEWVPNSDPCTGRPRPVLMTGVRLVDADGAELMLQIRPA